MVRLMQTISFITLLLSDIGFSMDREYVKHSQFHWLDLNSNPAFGTS